MDFDVSVIGLGRVGLPLAVSFADRGLRVLGIDNDAERTAAVRDGRMPFGETGMQEVLDRVHAAGTLAISERASDAAAAQHVVITLGTPSFSHIEIDLSQIRSVLDDLLPHLGEGHSRTLPCIVGGVGDRSGKVVGELFSVFGAKIVQTTPVQAELAKIWTNILRYTMFALPNLLMMDCEQYDANVFEVIDLINRDYPRGGMPQPGLTAGTCLRKDFAFSEERSRAPGMLLAVSRVNESVPLFLVQGMSRRMGGLKGKKVAVLGLAFKAGTDDERDSLAHKLVRLLERELADVAVHDPHVATPTQSFDDAVIDADAVVVATNHSEFCGADALQRITDGAKGQALLVDPWDCFGISQVFAYADEVAAYAPNPS
jgi:UDP-N-acetyl-D-mannosaminuronic acid dehydrogenase